MDNETGETAQNDDLMFEDTVNLPLHWERLYDNLAMRLQEIRDEIGSELVNNIGYEIAA